MIAPEEFRKLDAARKRQALLALRAENGAVRRGRVDANLESPQRRAGKDEGDAFPLSDLQAAYFVARCASEIDPVGCHYYLEFSVPELDVDRLEQAWQKLVYHHPMLRARVERDAVQSILTPGTIPRFKRHEIGPDEGELEQHLAAIRAKLSHKVYAIGSWPLYEIHVSLSPLPPARVHVSMDSWIVDRTSASVLFHQWRLLYESPERELPAQTAEFRDFVLYMRDSHSAPEHQSSMKYWADRLASRPESPRLPYRAASDKTASACSRAERRRLTWTSSSYQWRQIKRIASEKKLTPSVILLGIVAEQFHVVGCGDEFAFLLTLDRRPDLGPSYASVIGPISSSSVFVLEFQPHLRLEDRLRAYQQQLLRDLEHRTVSASDILRKLPRNPNHSEPSVVFTSSLGNQANGPSWLEDIDFAVSQTPGIDLDIQADEVRDALRLVWDVAQDRFEPGVMQEMFERICDCIQEIAAHGLPEFASTLLSSNARKARLRMLERQSEDLPCFPLTALQQAHLAARLADPENPTCSVYREFEVTPFDANRLQLAVNKIVNGSQSLRSVLSPERQQMTALSLASYRVEVDDLSDVGSEGDLAARLASIRQAMEGLFRGRPVWPYFAVRVSLLSAQRAIVHLVLDIVVFDGASICLFVAELKSQYAESAPSATLKPEVIGYPAYARARAAYLRTSAWTCDRLYWKNRFQSFPLDTPYRPNASASSYERFEARIAAWRVLKPALKQRGLPLWVLPLIAYRYVLRRHSGLDRQPVLLVDFQDRLLAQSIGSAYGDCSALGWLLREPPPTASVAEHCTHAAVEAGSDVAHSWGGPWDELRKAGNPIGHLAYVLTNCLDSPAAASAEMRQVYASSRTPSVEIDQIVTEIDEELLASWQVDVNRISRNKAQALFDSYCRILNCLAGDDANWDKPFSTLVETLDGGSMAVAHRVSEQKSSPLDRLNQTDALYDRQECIHRLIEKQVKRTPDHVALVSSEGSLSYRQLEEQANRIAQSLLQHGIGRHSRVGVLLDRSPETILLLLGILKAGAAYVPLAIADPSARREAMMRQAGVSAVVTELKHAPAVQGIEGCKIILLDALRSERNARGVESPPAVISSSEDTAYIIFTSGSTGIPKGVVIQHRPVINLIEWARKTYRFGSNDRVLFVNPLGFDLSVFDIFGILACGGSVRIASENDRLDPACLARIMLEESITFWNSAPAYLEFALAGLRARGVRPLASSLRLVFLSGDWIPLSLPVEIRGLFPSAAIVSLGGATEATVWSNYFDIAGVDPKWRSIPYGRPIQNVRYYILRDNLTPCEAGEAGELYIGGECLSSGYCSAPELTAKRFVPDPFRERPGTMYRTGDLARLMDENNIELLGRVDSQVKLRGFRVELGEVESALAKAGLKRPVAVKRGMALDRSLVAFYQIENHNPAPESEIKQRLARYLPAYMIPSQILALPEFPITANGKIDRQFLGEQPLEAISKMANRKSKVMQEERKDEPAIATLEVKLCEALAEVLSLAAGEIAATTDFSSLGVNSLHLALFSERASQLLRRTVSVVRLFQCTCVADVIDAFAGYGSPAKYNQTSETGGSTKQSYAHSERRDTTPHAVPLAPEIALKRNIQHEEYAIIGVDLSMPGARNAAEFWNNILDGRNCVGDVPSSRWMRGVETNSSNGPSTQKAALIEGIDRFDAAAFGISPREAELMDPRQRLLLQCAWRTFEHAGYAPNTLRGIPVGVFIGANGDEYASLLRNIDHPVDEFTLTGTGRSFIANRISYYFGWSGPSEVVDTTCSSSLVAVHNAVRAIQAGDCEIALAGGINIIIDPQPHSSLARIGVLSPDGACKSFDASANGYVRGEGFGFVLLKPMSRAVADRDHIHAVISGTAINHGGRSSSFSAPNSAAQANVIEKALRASMVNSQEIGYLEAHGTGTPLGDPIEIEGIKEAFRRRFGAGEMRSSNPVGVGSVKTVIGHLEAAAGIAGLIKVILMLRHGLIPPVGHLQQVNPRIDVSETPFVFHREAVPWKPADCPTGALIPRAAGVSAFGFGGVNAHVIVREAPARKYDDREQRASFTRLAVVLSAASRGQLIDYAASVRGSLDQLPSGATLSDVAFTLSVGRTPMKHRVAIMASSLEELATRLDDFRQGVGQAEILTGVAAEAGRSRLQPVQRDDRKASADAIPDVDDMAQLWVNGLEVDWAHLFRSRSPSRIPLPVYPFAPTRYWPSSLSASLLSGSDSAAQRNDDANRCVVELDEHVPFLRDHRIGGIPTLPASAYLGLALQMAQSLEPRHPSLRVSEMVWTRPFQLADARTGSKSLRINSQDKDGARYLIFSSREENQWVDHCSAKIVAHERPASHSSFSPDLIKRRSSTVVPWRICYSRLEEMGASFGPSLQSLRTLWLGESEAMAHVVLSAEAKERGFVQMVASLLDAAFQTMLLHEVLNNGRNELYLPFSVGTVSMQADSPLECFVYAVRAGPANTGHAVHRYNLFVLKPDGSVVASLKDCAGLAPRSRKTNARLFREIWRERGKVNVTPATQADVVHVTVGLPQIADELDLCGKHVAANIALPALGTAHTRAGAMVAWDTLLAGATPFHEARRIALWYNCSRLASLPVEEQLAFGFDTVFELIRQLTRTAHARSTRVAILLFDKDAVAPAPPILAALSGLTRAAQQEYPSLAIKVVECHGMAMPVSTTALAALDSILASSRDSIEHRIDFERNLHESRGLEEVLLDTGGRELPIKRNSLYLISGGGGAIGTILSRSIVAQGGRVALIGRSSATPSWIASSETEGRAAYYCADVASGSALDRLRSDLRLAPDALSGVFHCAGVARGALLSFKTVDDARLTLRAKVQGTIRLDELTKDAPLDFFVMFSSLASVTGTIGTSDYAYANRFLDLYASKRKKLTERGMRRGITVSISWPVWAQGGMTPPAQELEYMRRQGLECIDSSSALQVLAQCLQKGDGHYICTHGKPTWAETVLKAGYETGSLAKRSESDLTAEAELAQTPRR